MVCSGQLTLCMYTCTYHIYL